MDDLLSNVLWAFAVSTFQNFDALLLKRCAANGFTEANVGLHSRHRIPTEVFVQPNRPFPEQQDHNRSAKFKKPLVIPLSNPPSRLVTLLDRTNGKRPDFDHSNLSKMLGFKKRHHAIVLGVKGQEPVFRIRTHGKIPAGNWKRRMSHTVVREVEVVVVREIEPADD
jgi:hypothetical protein